MKGKTGPGPEKHLGSGHRERAVTADPVHGYCGEAWTSPVCPEEADASESTPRAGKYQEECCSWGLWAEIVLKLYVKYT